METNEALNSWKLFICTKTELQQTESDVSVCYQDQEQDQTAGSQHSIQSMVIKAQCLFASLYIRPDIHGDILLSPAAASWAVGVMHLISWSIAPPNLTGRSDHTCWCRVAPSSPQTSWLTSCFLLTNQITAASSMWACYHVNTKEKCQLQPTGAVWFGMQWTGSERVSTTRSYFLGQNFSFSTVEIKNEEAARRLFLQQLRFVFYLSSSLDSQEYLLYIWHFDWWLLWGKKNSKGFL